MLRVHVTLLAGLAVLITAVVLISRQSGPSPVTDAQVKSPPASFSPGLRAPDPHRRPPVASLQGLPALPLPVESPALPGSPADREWISTRIAELDDLSWFDDFDSLAKILAELRNPQPEIRAGALDAVKAFGSRDAIPYLAAIRSEVTDSVERKAIDAVIEYLNLPTVIEQFEGDVSE